jgi:hypothetical protein
MESLSHVPLPSPSSSDNSIATRLARITGLLSNYLFSNVRVMTLRTPGL